MGSTPLIDDLTRRALAVTAELQALGNERIEVPGGVIVRNRAVPAIRDENHVCFITAATPESIDGLLNRAEKEFDGFPHRRFDCDAATPTAFEARLALEGYERSDALVMLVEGELAGPIPDHDVRPVENEADWRSLLGLLEADWRETADVRGEPFDETVAQMAQQAVPLKSPQLTYWLAWLDGVPRAYFSSWAGVDGIGQVETLFTHPEYRHRGLATALIHRCVADCRSRGAGPVVIVASPTDTPKLMYAAMGFRPIALKREYLRLSPNRLVPFAAS